MRRLVERLSEQRIAAGVPDWLVPIALISVIGLLIQSTRLHHANFSVFLFDYEHGFIRRGLLGSIANLAPDALDPYYIYVTIYGATAVALYVLFILLFYRSLKWDEREAVLPNVLFCLVILVSPIFLKNAYHDFGRVDQLGYLCLLIFAVATPRAQRWLVVLMPPVLILCHEGQVILTLPPILAMFLIAALRSESLLRLRTIAPVLASIALSLSLTFYFLLHGVPEVDHETLSRYFESKSPHNTGERSWLLYDSVAANFEIAMGRDRKWRQLANSPLYVLTLIIHLPVIGLIYRIYRHGRGLALRLACGLVVATAIAQSVIFFLSIDYARHISNIFVCHVVLLLFLIRSFGLGALLTEQAVRYQIFLIALALIFYPIPRYGIISP